MDAETWAQQLQEERSQKDLFFASHPQSPLSAEGQVENPNPWWWRKSEWVPCAAMVDSPRMIRKNEHVGKRATSLFPGAKRRGQASGNRCLCRAPSR